jgi:hypothetical protein
MLRRPGVAPDKAKTRWVFTINNYGDDEEERVKVLASRPEVVAMSVGREEGQAGTPHLQGFVVMLTPISRDALEAALGGRAHIEPMHGSVRQNQVYCRKQRNMVVDKDGAVRKEAEGGKTRREIWMGLLEDARSMGPEEFATAHPDHWILRRAPIERLMIEAQATKGRVWDGELPTKNVWLWGAPGLGKSRWASIQNEVASVYKKNPNKWWDGFSPLLHKQVTIEDWAPTHECLTSHLKMWADRYPFIGEVKGSSFMMEPGRWNLVITSNYSIEECFNETDREAIKRRFAEIQMTQENKKMIDALRLTPP